MGCLQGEGFVCVCVCVEVCRLWVERDDGVE